MIEELVVGVGPVDDLRQLIQLDFRDVGKERCKRAVDSCQVGVSLEDRPGEERARQGRISALGVFSESVQLDCCEPNSHPIAVGETVEFVFVAEESKRLYRVPACFD